MKTGKEEKIEIIKLEERLKELIKTF